MKFLPFLRCLPEHRAEPNMSCVLFHGIVWIKAVSETTNRQIESVNRERESVATLLFFWDSLSNLVIDDNFRISNNLGLAANISTALAIQPDRDREIEIVPRRLYFPALQ